MAWYRTGTVAVTSGGPNVVGTGTLWLSYAKDGDGILLPDGKVYEVLDVVDDTHITLATNYGGSTASAQAYALFPTHAFSIQLSAQLTQLVSDYSAYVTGPGAGKFSDGAAATPGITWASDTDTGFYRPGANTLAMSVGGAEVMRATSTAFGFGTSSPSYFAHFSKNQAASTRVVVSNNDAAAFTSFDAVGTNTTLRMEVDTAGTSATVKTTTASPLKFGTGNSVQATLDTTGNVGIGTTAASTNRVDTLITANSAAGARIKNDSTGTAADARLTLESNAQTGGLILRGGNHSTAPNYLVVFNNTSNPITFNTGGAERARFDGTGMFGIGTVTPATYTTPFTSTAPRLAIGVASKAVATLRGAATADASSCGVLALQRTAAAAPDTLTATATGDTLGVIEASGVSATPAIAAACRILFMQEGVVSSNPSGQIKLQTANGGNPADRVIIDAAGRTIFGGAAVQTLQILAGANTPPVQSIGTSGVTGFAAVRHPGASAAAAPVFAFGRSRGSAEGSTTVVASGDTLGYLAWTGADGAAFQEAARIVAQVDGTPGSADMPGRLVFLTTPDASATPTEAARINNAQQLLVGQTSATGDAKIQVSNGVRFGGTLSSDPNTMDFYEEGTFTPAVVGLGTAGAGTYTAQTGRYTREGNRVHFNVTLTWTAHTGTGNMAVSGLPFTSNANGSHVCALRCDNLTYTGNLVAVIGQSSTQILFRQLSSGAAATDLTLDTAATIQISGTYEV